MKYLTWTKCQQHLGFSCLPQNVPFLYYSKKEHVDNLNKEKVRVPFWKKALKLMTESTIINFTPSVSYVANSVVLLKLPKLIQQSYVSVKAKKLKPVMKSSE